jgi:hypothetical protein
MKKLSAALLLLVALFFIATPTAEAAKKRIRKVAPRIAGVTYSTAKLSRGTNSISVSFINEANVKHIDYTLTYSTNGIPQGVVGSVSPSGSSDQRDLYFGTCSHGVCTPHYHITGASLTIETTFKDGSSNIKRYKIKI